MFVAARWKMALRFVASALLFESALSFRPVFQHQHVVPAECGRLFSAPLKSSGSGSGVLAPSRLQVERSRRRQRRRGAPPEQQPSLVVMLAGVEGGESRAAAAGDAGGVTRAGEAVGVPHAAAGESAPSPRAEQQVSLAWSSWAKTSADVSSSVQQSKGFHELSGIMCQTRLPAIQPRMLLAAPPPPRLTRRNSSWDVRVCVWGCVGVGV